MVHLFLSTSLPSSAKLFSGSSNAEKDFIVIDSESYSELNTRELIPQRDEGDSGDLNVADHSESSNFLVKSADVSEDIIDSYEEFSFIAERDVDLSNSLASDPNECKEITVPIHGISSRFGTGGDEGLNEYYHPTEFPKEYAAVDSDISLGLSPDNSFENGDIH